MNSNPSLIKKSIKTILSEWLNNGDNEIIQENKERLQSRSMLVWLEPIPSGDNSCSTSYFDNINDLCDSLSEYSEKNYSEARIITESLHIALIKKDDSESYIYKAKREVDVKTTEKTIYFRQDMPRFGTTKMLSESRTIHLSINSDSVFLKG